MFHHIAAAYGNPLQSAASLCSSFEDEHGRDDYWIQWHQRQQVVAENGQVHGPV